MTASSPVSLAFEKTVGGRTAVSEADPLPTTTTISGEINADAEGVATAAAPSYAEGAEAALSLNLTGDLRVIAKQSGAWTVTSNAGANLNTSLLALEGGGNLAAIAASASILDDWDESDRAKVNTIAGQVGVQGASGIVTALTQRVVLATDVALPAGTNTIGLVKRTPATTATLSALASGVSSATAVASNANRIGLSLFNTDANAVYVKFGATASATSFSVLIPASGFYEMPAPVYTGIIDAIWVGDGAGSLYATELT